MAKKNKSKNNVSAKYSQKPTFEDRDGNLYNDKNQRVIYTDFSGRPDGRSAFSVVWGTQADQNTSYFTVTFFNFQNALNLASMRETQVRVS